MNVPGEVVDRAIEGEVAAMDRGVHHHPSVAQQLRLQLVKTFFRCVEAVRVAWPRLSDELLEIERPALAGHRVLPHRCRVLYPARGQPADRRDRFRPPAEKLVLPIVTGETLVGGQVRTRRSRMVA